MSRASIIAKREIASYFTSPMAYIVSAFFLLFCGFLFFSTFFLSGRAELRGFFTLLPLAFSLFIPALTMRMFSEEKRSGSLETLSTLPVCTRDIVLGKYVASLTASLALLVPTLLYVLICALFGSPDAGPIIGGYLGAILLASSFTAIGLFASSCTKNQIVSFFIALALCGILVLISIFSVFLPGAIAGIADIFSASSHFESISRGVLDTRDIIYFLSLTVFFLFLTAHTIDRAK